MEDQNYAQQDLHYIHLKSEQVIENFKANPDRNLSKAISFTHSILKLVQLHPNSLSKSDKSKLKDYANSIKQSFNAKIEKCPYYSNNDVVLYGTISILEKLLN